MGINNKQRRADKKRKKLKLQRNKATKKQTNKSPYPLFSPFDTFPDLSVDDRKKMIEEFQKNSEKLYSESLEKILSIFAEYDPLILLSMLSNYGLTVGIGDNGISQKEKEQNIQQTHVEIAQAILLTLKVQNNYKLPTSDVYQTLHDSLITLMFSFSFMRQKAEILDFDDRQLSIIQVQERVRGHTQIVRNWGYYSQVKKISIELYSTFDEILEKEYGFSATTLIRFFELLSRIIQEKINIRFQVLINLFRTNDLKKIAYEYHKLTNEDENATIELINFIEFHKLSKEEVFSLIISHYDLRISENYIFDINEFSVLASIPSKDIELILNEFSYVFGDLETTSIEYFYLANPIWTKPIIRLDSDHFYCPMPQLFFSFILKSLDCLIETKNEKMLSKRKSLYLENKIEEIVHSRFPEANTVKNMKWQEGDSVYETDIITAIDSYIIIIEAKSGKIDPSALRGAPSKLERDIKKLLIEPNLQSKRLKDKLLYLIKNPDIEDELRNKLPFDLKKIHKVLRISVTLEYFASLQSNIKRLEKTDWIPENFEYCPTMNIADFETIFDILEYPVEIINYLEKREHIESTTYYMGDELDLLGYYIDYHLNFPVIKEQSDFILTGMSNTIDNYYDSKDAGVFLPKPRVKMNKLFQSIIQLLEQRKTHRWTEIGTILYSFLPEDQDKLASYVYKIKNNVKKNWMKEGHENTIIYIPPLNTEYALCYIAINNQNKSQRYTFAAEAARQTFEKKHVKFCLVISKNIDDEKPYGTIAMYESHVEDFIEP
ncbi:MAG: hypothetical protein AB7D16_11980 [Eubacteriaceae bacterium]